MKSNLRFRLTALFVVILGITLVVFSALLYRAFINNQQYEFDNDLYNHAVDVAQAIDVSLLGDVAVRTDILSRGGKVFPFSVGKSFLQIRGPNGNILARSRALENIQLPYSDADQKLLVKNGVSFKTLKFDHGNSYRLISYLVREGPLPKYILQIAVPLSFLEQQIRSLILFFLTAIPITLGLATFGGLYLSGRALSPVNDIIAKAKSLRASNLSERIPVPQVDDELKRLSLTLNELLDRLQLAFESQERFVADASHQLKTPLAILRGEFDLVKSKNRSPQEIHEFIDSASQELDYLSRIVEDLLLLARMDAGYASLSIQKVRLDEAVLEAVSRLEILANAKGVKIRLNLSTSDENSQESFQIEGDKDLLQSMIQNLVENAIKYSPASMPIDVQVKDTGDQVSIQVSDQGEGIPGAVQSKIFERFYRAKDHEGKIQGVGLGLPIARRIAEAHKGTLVVKSPIGPENSGTTFTFQIKKL